MWNYIIIIVILLALAILYKRFETKHKTSELYDNFIEKYLLTSKITKSKKPFLWIHVPYEYNSRKWENFGSRSSTDLNQPYLYLTVKSIIQKCEKSFTINLIDDASFSKIIPNWNINIKLLSTPILQKVRELAMAKIIYKFGGIIVPISFLCFKNLDGLYETGTRNDKMFICEGVDRNITSSAFDFYPNINFMGAEKQNSTMKQLIDFMQQIISSDNTSQSQFLGDFNRWCNNRINKSHINLIDGKYIGTKTMDGEVVIVDNLLGDDYIDFYDKSYGILIPADDILKRTYYEWFARQSATQVLEGGSILSKHILLANAPRIKEQFKEKPNWISFWKVPSGAPVYGMMPNNLGDRVSKSKY